MPLTEQQREEGTMPVTQGTATPRRQAHQDARVDYLEHQGVQRGVHGDKGGEKERSEGTEGRVRLTFRSQTNEPEIWVVTHV